MVRLVPLWRRRRHGATRCWNRPQRSDVDIDGGLSWYVAIPGDHAIFCGSCPERFLFGMFFCTFDALMKHLESTPGYYARSFPDRKSCLDFWEQQLPGIACPEVLVCGRPRRQGLDADSYVSILAIP